LGLPGSTVLIVKDASRMAQNLCLSGPEQSSASFAGMLSMLQAWFAHCNGDSFMLVRMVNCKFVDLLFASNKF
jgi:hypothetical protein